MCANALFLRLIVTEGNFTVLGKKCGWRRRSPPHKSDKFLFLKKYFSYLQECTTKNTTVDLG